MGMKQITKKSEELGLPFSEERKILGYDFKRYIFFKKKSKFFFHFFS